MIKKVSSLLIGLLLLSLVLGQNDAIKVSASSVEGIPSAYESEITFLTGKSIIQGYPDGHFHGSDEVTREQAATMVGRALDLEGEQRDTKFPDVDENSFASGYIQSAVEAGVIKGYPDGTYQPKSIMTRGEMAYLISNAFNLKATSEVSYHDVKEGSNVATPVNLLTTAGISEGTPEGNFLPDKTITRTEFSLFIARGLNADFKVSQDEEEEEEAQKALSEKVVDADFLNVRQGPGTEHKTVGKLMTGETVSVYKKEGDWRYIQSGNLKGYVHSYYLLDKPKGDWKVALDPGHGGRDPGASANGLIEKEVVLDVGLRVREYVENAGIDTVMTRQTDWYPSLAGRVVLATDNNADAFVSIHANAFMKSATGVETFYYSAGLSDREYASYRLATFINDRLYKEMDMYNRGVKDVGYKVIKDNPLPAVLTEIGFLTNDEDSSKLKTDKYREAAARAIAMGIVDYYNWKE
ncbi:N-acetylmuramoyl-L-alanine amidase [Halobacillus dabanensis]|uniref:N-acetylmuramoyl-L-alanine amidase n=1 Tax=Halobacillus dabanensis TaxID=240302 RepID=A0A1I3XEH4_HALDA|nr:N-acetylmuramoyl-L-alanine amidase [Halobacillus dabanensis]SFK17882.1 N-acetylmuramoyl-L-alanine amidase [Halobacillus dabanensis]